MNALAATAATVLSLLAPPAHLPEGARIGTLVVPRIHLTTTVVQGGADLYTAEWPRTLNDGPAHYPDTSLPWQYGTVGIAGHRVTHTRPFLHLDAMRVGDRITLKTRYGIFRYRVYRVLVVQPDAVWILNGRTKPRLVLTACNPPHQATSRIAVFARPV